MGTKDRTAALASAPMNASGRSASGHLIKRSFALAGHRTSVALEAEFWDVLRDIARSQGLQLGQLVATVDAERDGTAALASSLRLLALRNALNRTNGPEVKAEDLPDPGPGF